MISTRALILCNSPSFPAKTTNHRALLRLPNPKPQFFQTSFPRNPISINKLVFHNRQPGGLLFQFHRISYSIKDSGEQTSEEIYSKENAVENGKTENKRDWSTSFLLFVLWGSLLYYIFFLAPNQTPVRDLYFLQKLLNLKGDDGFQMNEVLVSLWYIMGLWPLLYSMLLLPNGRSSGSKVPVSPFIIMSFFGGAYALLPYFVLWMPPPPPVDEAELRRWPLNFLESKITSGVLVAAGLGLMIHAGLAGGDIWREFYQYFRESKFIHVTCLDFSLLSAFAPFWVYQDMTSRKWFDKGSWLLPLSLVPFLGPSLYLFLRPQLLLKSKAEND